MSVRCNISVRACTCCAGELIGVEYLYSQTGAVLQQDWDPDTPDGTGEAEEDWKDGDEGFEEEEEEPEEIRLLSHHHALLLRPPEPRGAPATAAVAEASTSQSGPTHAPPAEAEDDVSRGMPVFISPVRVTVWCGFMSRLCAFLQDVVGPDGHGGYQLVVPLAHALVDLRDRAFVPHRQARDIIALWQKLSDRDKAAVTFPPRHQDRLVQGRFKTSHRHAHIPGVDSVKR